MNTFCKKCFQMLLSVLIFQNSSSQGMQDSVFLATKNKTEKVIVITANSFVQTGCEVCKNKELELIDTKQEGKSWVETLEKKTSFYFKKYGNGQLASVSFNGTAAAQTNILWNGIKLNQAANGQNDLNLFLQNTSQQLTTTLGGYNGAIGSNIYLNNSAKFKTFSSQQVFRYGSFQTLNILSDNSYGSSWFKGSTSFSMNYSKNNFAYNNPFLNENRTNTIQHNAFQSWNLIQNLGFQLPRNFVLDANLWFNQMQREIPPIMTANKSSENQYDGSSKIMLDLRRNNRFWSFSVKSAFLLDNYIYTNEALGITSKMNEKASKNLFLLAYSKNNLDVTSQVFYDFEKVSSDGFLVPKTRNNYGVKIGTLIKLNNYLRIAFRVKQDFSNAKPLPTAVELSTHFAYLKSLHKFNLEGNLATAYRQPSLNDLYWKIGGNANLKNEKSYQANLLLEYSYNSILNFSFSNYYNYVTDWILWKPNTTAVWSAENVQQVFSRGFNSNLTFKTTQKENYKKLNAVFSFNYSFTKTTNLVTKSQHIYVPLHNANLTARVNFCGFYLLSNTQFISKRFTTSDNSLNLPAYFLTNLELGKTFFTNVCNYEISARMNNLLNQSYQSIALRPMAGRGFEVCFKLNLKKV